MEFLYSDDPFSIFLFTLITVVLFILLLNLLMGVITSLMSSDQEYIVQGMIPGNITKYVPVDPKMDGSIPLDRSKNKSGIEFSWSVWLNVNDIDISKNTFLHVFNKGEQGMDDNGKNVANNSPGVYLQANSDTNSCSLHVLMNTFGTAANDEIVIPNFPMNKWVHCAIRVQNLSVDIYINGVLAQRKNLQTLPQQNYYDTYVGHPNGFNGYISSLNYYAYALNYDQIQSDYAKGPNMKLKGQTNQINYKDYLAMNWYYS